MPRIHVLSLPSAEDIDVPAAVADLSAAIVEATGISADDVLVTWSFVAPGHYANRGGNAESQPRRSHPVQVDVTAPDSHSDARVEAIMELLAERVAALCAIESSNVLVLWNEVRPGRVFDKGGIVRW